MLEIKFFLRIGSRSRSPATLPNTNFIITTVVHHRKPTTMGYYYTRALERCFVLIKGYMTDCYA